MSLVRDIEKRVEILMTVILLVFLILFGQLFRIQVVKGESYELLSQGNRERQIPITAPRGNIYDRYGRIIASSKPAFTLSLMFMNVGDVDVVVKRLSVLLGLPESEIREKIEKQKDRLYEPVRLMTDISPEIQTIVEEHKNDLPGVVIEIQPIRDYPWGEVGAHFLGHLGQISEEELAKFKQFGYDGGDVVGKMGIEATYELYLHGKDGGRLVQVDAFGRPVGLIGTKDPVSGSNLTLSIDMGLQKAAEDALNEIGKPGAVVAMNPKTGEILALVSRPSFDPNWFASGSIDSEKWKELLENPQKPFRNRAIKDSYPPGSTFKMVVALAALESGVTNPRETFRCTGTYWVIPMECWAKKFGGHGLVNLVRGIAESCNVVFYELGRRTGIDAIVEMARRFGFGEPTGIKDIGGEEAGVLPSPAWKAARYPDDPNWYMGDTLNTSIGQGFHAYTPLRMACYVSMIANGGVNYRPFLVKRVVSPEGRLLVENEPEVLGTVRIRQDLLDIVRQGMLGVTRPGGTAAAAFNGFPIPVAGKTGTAEVAVPGKKSHGWFIGYAPFDDPEIAVSVFVEEGEGGAVTAAPIARKIMDYYFAARLKELKKDERPGVQSQSPVVPPVQPPARRSGVPETQETTRAHMPLE